MHLQKENRMKLSSVKSLCLLFLSLVGIAPRSEAAILTVPTGLGPGDTYRLVFFTGDATTATSTNIGDYNAFVTAEADSVGALAALGASWSVLASTESVNVETNIGDIGDIASGIYNLAGQEVASDTDALFNVTYSANYLDNPIDIDQGGDQSGNTVGITAWTGTNIDGSTYSGYALGDSRVLIGNSQDVNGYYVAEGSDAGTNSNHLYAISSVLTVSSTPEPSTIDLFALAGVFLLLAGRCNARSDRDTET
jgi:hypothetical protein